MARVDRSCADRTITTVGFDNPCLRRRAVANAVYLLSAAVVAISAAPGASADVEYGQVCTGPRNVISACQPTPIQWPPPGAPCKRSGPSTMACGGRPAGLARLGMLGMLAGAVEHNRQ